MARNPFSAAAQGSSHRTTMSGLHLGVVVNNKTDDPIYPLELQIMALPGATKTKKARWVVPMAGNGCGTYQLPEPQDQVLVVFANGDTNYPIAIGMLWSTKAPPPEKHQSGQNNTKVIKSKSGHRLLFSDQHGEEQIAVVDSAGNYIQLTGDGKVRIQCTGTVTLKAQNNVILHSQTLEIAASGAVAMKADTRLALECGGTKTVVAGGPLSFTGKVVTANMAAGGGGGGGQGQGDLGPAQTK